MQTMQNMPDGCILEGNNIVTGNMWPSHLTSDLEKQ